MCRYLRHRPISLWDSEYGCAPFVLKTAEIAADKLIRLRSNLCLWGAPPPYSGKGRPRIHGEKFKLNDQKTWGEAVESLEVDHPKLGRLRIRLWRDLHFRACAKCPMLLLQVERLQEKRSGKVSKPLWLAWVGEEMPPLSEVWRLYLRRFAVDHWYRKASQRLHWTLPKLSTKQQCERWSDLMPLLSWELWLAREIVADKPLTKATLSASAHSRSGRSGDGWSFSHDGNTTRILPNLVESLLAGRLVSSDSQEPAIPLSKKVQKKNKRRHLKSD